VSWNGKPWYLPEMRVEVVTVQAEQKVEEEADNWARKTEKLKHQELQSGK
jgi:hypothetical protein